MPRLTPTTPQRCIFIFSDFFTTKRFLYVRVQILQDDTILWETAGGIPNCAYWSESNNTWQNDGIVLESYNADPDGRGKISCSTYHLSAYAVSGTESVSGEWGFLNPLGGINALQEVCFVRRPNPSMLMVRAVLPRGTQICKLGYVQQ